MFLCLSSAKSDNNFHEFHITHDTRFDKTDTDEDCYLRPDQMVQRVRTAAVHTT